MDMRELAAQTLGRSSMKASAYLMKVLLPTARSPRITMSM